jgi:hypothetical protein
MSQIHDYEPVATLVLASSGTVGQPSDPPGWHVAFYNLATRPSGYVRKIDGVPFVFVQRIGSRLDGAILDYRNNRFVVDGSSFAH